MTDGEVVPEGTVLPAGTVKVTHWGVKITYTDGREPEEHWRQTRRGANAMMIFHRARAERDPSLGIDAVALIYQDRYTTPTVVVS